MESLRRAKHSARRKGMIPLKYQFDIIFHSADGFAKKIGSSLVVIRWTKGEKIDGTKKKTLGSFVLNLADFVDTNDKVSRNQSFTMFKDSSKNKLQKQFGIKAAKKESGRVVMTVTAKFLHETAVGSDDESGTEASSRAESASEGSTSENSDDDDASPRVPHSTSSTAISNLSAVNEEDEDDSVDSGNRGQHNRPRDSAGFIDLKEKLFSPATVSKESAVAPSPPPRPGAKPDPDRKRTPSPGPTPPPRQASEMKTGHEIKRSPSPGPSQALLQGNSAAADLESKRSPSPGPSPLPRQGASATPDQESKRSPSPGPSPPPPQGVSAIPDQESKEEKIARLTEERNGLQKEKKILRHEKQEAEHRCFKLEEELAAANDKIADLRRGGSDSDLADELEDTLRRAEDAEDRCKQLEEEIDKLRASAREAKEADGSRQLKDDLRKLQSEKRRLEAEVTRLSAENGRLKRQLEDLQDGHSSRSDDESGPSASRVLELERTNDDLRAQLEQFKSEARHTPDACTNGPSKAQLQEQLAQEQRRSREIQQRLQKERDELSEELAQWEQDVRQLKVQLSDVSTKNDQLCIEAEAFRKERDLADRHVKEVEARCLEAIQSPKPRQKGRHSESQSEEEQDPGSAHALEMELAATNQKLFQVQADSERSVIHVKADADQKISELTQKIHSLEMELRAKEQKLHEAHMSASNSKTRTRRKHGGDSDPNSEGGSGSEFESPSVKKELTKLRQQLNEAVHRAEAASKRADDLQIQLDAAELDDAKAASMGTAERERMDRYREEMEARVQALEGELIDAKVAYAQMATDRDELHSKLMRLQKQHPEGPPHK